MTVLILSRSAMSFSPYHEWLADAGEPLILLTSQSKLDLPPAEQEAALTRYAEVRCYEDYMDGIGPERDAVDIAQRGDLSAVVALSEIDLVRAGTLRDEFGIAGQGRASAIAFRDKVRMKELLAAGGVPVAAFRPVETVVDIYAFVAEHGFPVVVKPRNGYGSIGVTILRTDADLDAFTESPLSPRMEFVPDLMVEEFIAGDEYLVDGIVLDGEIRLAWPSKYVNSPAAYAAGEGLHTVMVDADDPLTPRLRASLRQALAALPTPDDCTFHCELFHSADDRIRVGEVASRTGGGRINDAVRSAFGINLNRSIVRAQAGRTPDVPVFDEYDVVRRNGVAGTVKVGRRRGRLHNVPRSAPMEWATRFRSEVGEGDLVTGADSSTACVASAVVVGATSAQVRSRIDEFVAWYWNSVSVTPEA